jgi:hypothetical protein
MPSLRLAVHANRADTKKYKLNYAGSIRKPAARRRARIGCAGKTDNAPAWQWRRARTTAGSALNQGVGVKFRNVAI